MSSDGRGGTPATRILGQQDGHRADDSQPAADASAGDEQQSDETPETLSSVDAVPEPQARYSVFTSRQKYFILVIASVAALFSPLSSNIYFPAINNISTALGVSTEKINLTMTAYMCSQAVTPIFWGSLTDRIGRRPVYIATFLIYIAACLGLAMAKQYWLHLVLRMLQAAGSASVIAIGSGTISDISTPVERAGFAGFFSVGQYAGPAMGPFLGGILTAKLGYHSIFWFLVCAGGVHVLVIIFFLPETMRDRVANGSYQPSSKWKLPLMYSLRLAKKPTPEGAPPPPPEKRNRMNPLRAIMILKEKDVSLILLFNAFIYTNYQMITCSTDSIFRYEYGLSTMNIGFCYIGNGVGAMIGSILRGKLLDRAYRHQREQWQRRRAEEGGPEKPYDDSDISTFNIERARLVSLPLYYFINVASTLAYGWFVAFNIHLAAPIISQFFVGLSATSIFGITSTMLLDIYPMNAASAIGANNLTRCLMGAAGVAGVESLLKGPGPGLAFTMTAAICLAAFPLPLIEYKWGFKWRMERMQRLAEKEDRKKEMEEDTEN